MRPALCMVDPPEWMTDRDIWRLVDVLVTAGGQARFVGGCVRDALLGRVVNDIDIATTLPPEQVMAALDGAGVGHRPTGLDHGTVTALLGADDGLGHRQPVEITTLRRDLETDGRRAVVGYTTDWLSDAERRDFTMNALFADSAGVVFDPFGGIDDAFHGRVRFIGDPVRRIDEDALRILRFFRFFAWYGVGAPDERGVDACRVRRAAVAGLSGERVRSELLKLVAAPDPVPAWRSMAACGVIDSLFNVDAPEAVNWGAIALGAAIDARLGDDDCVFRLGLVLAPILSSAVEAKFDAIADRLRLSRQERRRIGAMAMAPSVLRNRSARIDARTVRRLAVSEGADLALTVLLLAHARQHRGGGAEGATGRADSTFRQNPRSSVAPGVVPDVVTDVAPDAALGAEIDSELIQAALKPPVFPLQGRDVVATGCRPGPEVGRFLKAVKEWWLERDCRPDRQDCLEELSRRIGTKN